MRIAWCLCACLMASGCDLLFTLDAPPPICDEASDEDCDTIANAEDLCPSDADLAADQDADGVDDACDPNQGTADTLALFDGLNEVALWTTETGVWDPVDGAFEIAGSGGIERAILALMRPAILIVIDDLDLPVGASIGAFAEAGGFRSGCEVANVDGSFVLRTTADVPMSIPISGTGTLRISGGQLANNDTFCRARFADGVAVQFQEPFPFGVITVDNLGLLAVDASARFRSIAVFAMP